MNNNDITIFHNPRCSKSRQAYELLQATGRPLIVKEYLKDSPTRETLTELLKLLVDDKNTLIRRDANFKKLELTDRDFSDAEIIDLLEKHPELLERPVISYQGQAFIGRPSERVTTFITNLD